GWLRGSRDPRRPGAPGSRPLPLPLGLLVVMNHLSHDEAEPLLGELGVEVGLFRELMQAGDLALLAGGVARGQVVLGFEGAHLLRAAEALGEHVHERSVDVVDAGAQAQQGGHGVVVRFAHATQRIGRTFGSGSSGATAAGCCSRRARASAIARSSCGSRSLNRSAGSWITSTSGSTPWFSTPHPLPSSQYAYRGCVTPVPSTRSNRPSMPTTPPHVRAPTTGPSPSAWARAFTMSPSDPENSFATKTTGPRRARSGSGIIASNCRAAVHAMTRDSSRSITSWLVWPPRL